MSFVLGILTETLIEDEKRVKIVPNDIKRTKLHTSGAIYSHIITVCEYRTYRHQQNNRFGTVRTRIVLSYLWVRLSEGYVRFAESPLTSNPSVEQTEN